MGSMCYAVYFPFFAAHLVMVMATYSNLFGQTVCVVFGCEHHLGDARAETGCKTIYYLGVFTFMVITGTLTALNYDQQIWMHRIMVVIQFIFTIIITIFAIQFFSAGNYEPIERNVPIDFKGFLYSFQVIMFACWYLTATPSVLAASAKHHKNQKKVAFWIFASSMVIYGVIGCVVGTLLEEVSSNNIIFYQKYLSLQKEQSFLLFAILVIPAVDIISNSPIICQILSGALFSALYGANHKVERKKHPDIYLILRVSSAIYPFLIASIIPKFVSAQVGKPSTSCWNLFPDSDTHLHPNLL